MIFKNDLRILVRSAEGPRAILKNPDGSPMSREEIEESRRILLKAVEEYKARLK